TAEAPAPPHPFADHPALTGGPAGPAGCTPGGCAPPGREVGLPAGRRDCHFGPWDTVWVTGGYKLLFIKDAPLPPNLAATGPLGPGSRPLLGGGDVNYGDFNGLFLDGGLWLNDRHTVGIGMSGFLTEQKSTVAGAVGSNPAGSPLIARPFFNPLLVGLGGQDAVLVSDPGRYAGSVAVETGARLAGAEVNGLLNLCNTERWTANLVGGFRYFDLDEYLAVYQATAGLNGNTIPFFAPPNPPVGGVLITDRVRTRNQFWGGQVGLEAEYRFGPAFLGLGTKLGFGPVHQVTEVTGQTVTAGGAGGPGGVLAVGDLPPGAVVGYPEAVPVGARPASVGGPVVGNIGRTTTNRFAILSDVHGLAGVQVSDRLRVGVGYEFLYLSTVARPGRQFDPVIDPRLIPVSGQYGGRIAAPADGRGVPPRTPFDRDDFFAHGVRFQVEFRY
ncbi:MAG: BBP7 family outer membrane beta-barrel protein, partial [Gemmataceae bacterium]|nr:BBP7 family outer membrane beta-barrel protein [Gemmataceae bacterium]